VVVSFGVWGGGAGLSFGCRVPWVDLGFHYSTGDFRFSTKLCLPLRRVCQLYLSCLCGFIVL